MDFAKIIQRAKNILLSPKTEWPVIAAEPATVASVYQYAIVMAALPAIAGLIGGMLFGAGLMFGLVSAILGYALGLAMVYVIARIVDALAPSFGGEKNFVQSLKLIVYCSTATWVAGISAIIPFLSMIIGLIGLVYAIYLLYLGAEPVKKVPGDRAVGFTAVVLILWLVLYFVIAAVIAGITFAMIGGAAMTGALGS